VQVFTCTALANSVVLPVKQMIISYISNMPIREASIQDYEQLHHIRMSVKENVLNTPGLVTYNDYEQMLSRRGKGWLYADENEIAGFAIVDLVDRNVWALFLLPEKEGQGIGRALHDKMLDWYFNQTNDELWLSTDPDTRAHKFYLHKGWQPAGMLKNEVKLIMTSEQWKQSKK
jgi:GNAT superfamily N-acetyltransferase